MVSPEELAYSSVHRHHYRSNIQDTIKDRYIAIGKGKKEKDNVATCTYEQEHYKNVRKWSWSFEILS